MNISLKLTIEKREPFASGISFGDTGPYERIAGQVLYIIKDPTRVLPRITDLDKAAPNPDGLVEFSANFYILKPLDMREGNRRLLYNVVNRGNAQALRTFNDAPQVNEPITSTHAGNGFLMRKGYTVAWSGWQGDLLPGEGRFILNAPIASEKRGSLIDKVRAEFIADGPDIYSFPLSGNNFSRSYEAADLDTSKSILTCRQYEEDPRKPIPADQWQFAKAKKDPVSGQWRTEPSSTNCFLSGGFKPGWIYELIYPAKDPRIMGLGFVSVREFVTFLRYSSADVIGTLNPLKEQGEGVDKAYAWGASQSGRFLRGFLYNGFNEADGKRKVFDGIFPHSAGGGGIVLNYRFAQPGRFSCQHEEHLYPSDLFPFSYTSMNDSITGRTDSILKRPETDPLVIETQNPVDYWQRRGSLVHTDSKGSDIVLPEKVRVYLLSSTSSHPVRPDEERICKYHVHIQSPSINAVFRALLELLDRWASKGIPPPESLIPTRGKGDLVTLADVQARFPRIPGVTFPDKMNRLRLVDYGTEMGHGIIGAQPLVEGKEYSVLLPQVDKDGNDIPGIHLPDIRAPLATHCGWNLRGEGFNPGALAKLMGSYFPFPKNTEEREANGDPRLSIQERYHSLAGYVRAVARAVENLVSEGFLLEEDADRLVEAAIRCKLFE